MIKTIKTAALTILACGVFVGCSKKNQEVSKNVKGGWVSETSYENEFFGITIDSPDGWRVDKTNPKLEDDIVVDTAEGRQFKEAANKTYTPFFAEAPDGSNFGLTIENVEGFNLDSADAYLDEALKTFKLLKMECKVVNRKKNVNYLGAEWSCMTLENKLEGILIYQKMYVMLKEENILILALSTLSLKDEALDEVVNASIKFSN